MPETQLQALCAKLKKKTYSLSNPDHVPIILGLIIGASCSSTSQHLRVSILDSGCMRVMKGKKKITQASSPTTPLNQAWRHTFSDENTSKKWDYRIPSILALNEAVVGEGRIVGTDAVSQVLRSFNFGEETIAADWEGDELHDREDLGDNEEEGMVTTRGKDRVGMRLHFQCRMFRDDILLVFPIFSKLFGTCAGQIGEGMV